MVASTTRQTNWRTASKPGENSSDTKANSNDFMGGIPMVVSGNLVDDPELRFTPSGKAVASFRIASTSRINRDGEWQDGSTVFLNVTVWGDQAERVCDTSIGKGMRLLIHGRLQERHWENKEGEKRRSFEIVADECALSLRFKPAAFVE